jgi:hypothetical protein
LPRSGLFQFRQNPLKNHCRSERVVRGRVAFVYLNAEVLSDRIQILIAFKSDGVGFEMLWEKNVAAHKHGVYNKILEEKAKSLLHADVQKIYIKLYVIADQYIGSQVTEKLIKYFF